MVLVIVIACLVPMFRGREHMHPAAVTATPAPSVPPASSAQPFTEDPELAGYREAARQHPENPNAQFQLAWALYGRTRYAEAIAIMDRILPLDPDGRIYDLRAAARMQADHSPAGLARSIDDLKQAARQFPNWSQAHEDLGKACAEGTRWDEAASEIEKAIALTPEQPHDYYDLMRAYRQMRQPAKAAAAGVKFAAANKEVQRRYKLQALCTSQPQNADAFRELGLLQLKNGLYTVAIQYLHHAASLRPDDAQLQADIQRAETEWKRSDRLAFGSAARMQ
jgi:tetratricopeptide (TPR) repeat protein